MAEFFKLEIANWNVGTDNLTLEQEAAYLRIIGMIRLYEQPLKHNLRVLAGLWRCNERKATRLLDELIDAGKLSVLDGLIINEKAVDDASNLRQLRVDRASAGRLGGIESGKVRRKSLNDNNTIEASALTRLEKTRLEKKDSSSSSTQAREIEPVSQASTGTEADKLLADVMHAVGLTNGKIPTYWMPPAATVHVWRWHTDLGLSAKHIVDAARESRKTHATAPSGPKALDGQMQRLAAAINSEALTPSPSTNQQEGTPNADQRSHAADTSSRYSADRLNRIIHLALRDGPV